MDKADIRKDWVERLRSGKIRQTRSVLGTPDGARCCLGVLCDIAVRRGVIPAPIKAVDNSGNICVEFLGIGKFALDYLVSDMVGLASSVGRFNSKHGIRQSLAYLNDHGATFTQIADIIESEPEGLFL